MKIEEKTFRASVGYIFFLLFKFVSLTNAHDNAFEIGLDDITTLCVMRVVQGYFRDA